MIYYWVRIAGEWKIAEYSNECFYLPGIEYSIDELTIEEIDTEPINRQQNDKLEGRK